jgi:isoleucyl-tRNA synthetase
MSRLISLREAVLKELEKAREGKLIGNSLEAHVHLAAPAADEALYRKYEQDFCALFIVSAVTVEPGGSAELGVRVTRAEGEKCRRCWNYSAAVGRSPEYPQLCRRCEDVVREIR